MNIQADFFVDVEAQLRRQQFRMRRLQVFNWGTFSNLHDIAIAEDGFLFVGRSGSGKSTLLDALAALLVPPKWLAFNAAAREGDRGRRDRNLASYVRGAWGDQKDLGSGEIATRFLRTGTTWSALALTYANADDREVTLIQLYWLRGNAAGNQDVGRHYMIAGRGFDVARELEGFDLDIRGLKKRLEDVDHFGSTFSAYGERFRQLLGIESEMALKLLHKTQSAKNLGDLNGFLREFMLDQPKSFEVADRMVAEFGELDAAHQEVVTTRRQVDTLKPAREQHTRKEALEETILEQERLLQAIDGYTEQRRLQLLDQEIEALHTRDRGLEGEQQQRREQLESEEERLRQLEMQHRERGGDRIEALERERARTESLRDERLQRRGQLEQACQVMGWAVPDHAHRFGEQVAEARHIVEAWGHGQEAVDDRRDAIRDQKGEAEKEFTAVRREIDAMERQPSNIPAHMLELRASVAAAVGCSEAELPFAGELIQVKEEAAEWQGAIERLLHGFALSLLVEQRYYAAVSSHINDTHLGGRLVYYRIDDGIAPAATEPRPASLLHKLALKETTFRPWLEAELARRFDYACVDSLQDFRREKRALTRQGQVRHGPDRHEKDDRHRIDDRRRWVLGFDNREKLAMFKARAQELGAIIAQCNEELEALRQEREAQRQRVEACMSISNLVWTNVDVASALDRIAALDEQLREMREGNRELRELGKRMEAQRACLEKAKEGLRNVEVERGNIGYQVKNLTQEREATDHQLATLIRPDATQRETLEERFAARGEVTRKNLDDRRRQVERALNDQLKVQREERANCIKRMETAFAEFKREWPQEGADVDATVESAPEFLRILERLERDGLPEYEQRFFDMLREQSTENLAALNAQISQARKEIHARMELVNEGLADAEFNSGTYLQIDINDRHLPDVRAFREQVQQVLGHAWQMDRESAEDRFLVLRDMVRRLGGDEPEQRRWREQVLDVRLHVEFIGRELDQKNDYEVEIYRGSQGKSGGQREKLATTCLAAALRYQLGGSDGGLPVYAAVVLDEAFGKADNEFTELALRIFKKFGFQMIVATPLKSVMTLEPFIGGACFVDITERKRSATLPIEYDHSEQRLKLSAQAHGEDLPA
ncbi:Uncharacterized protein YPO0396 [Ectothiorhodospira mobilis]|uniref:Uncharacterized protein YPO0396 n=1 Tax=Ectothiorhodospira mobilis TaxID=195064 RepID=A0A1I4RTH8_ECTMO|nr:ATP-binding protein [Ectothiorhodospira mobilis]SFM55547.1 Uncharacterized protein YPO0396 [Ectothiorhodospira mobilis]